MHFVSRQVHGEKMAKEKLEEKIKIAYERIDVGVLSKAELTGATPDDPRYNKAVDEFTKFLKTARAPDGGLEISGVWEFN